MTVATPALTVRDQCWAVLRAARLTQVFANPGSTEVPLLVGMPDDFEFVLGLHESAVVGMATGVALATGRPALALLHTTAGLGNAIGALATARENRVPLVVLVGQQDRRHLVNAPFLAGELANLAGNYPVWVGEPPRSQDLPDLIARAVNEAIIHRGPAIVIVPMNDWAAALPDPQRTASPREVLISGAASADAIRKVADVIADASSPVIVSGAGAATQPAWDALEALVSPNSIPVWQESFGAAPGYRQTAPEFQGLLPSGREELRRQLAPHDLVVVVGAHALRQYGYEPGPLFADGTRVIVISDDAAKAVVSTADLAIIAPIPETVAAVADHLQGRAGHVRSTQSATSAARHAEPASENPPASARPSPSDVFRALARHADEDVVLFEETPSTRAVLTSTFPAQTPAGYISAAMGGLGFAMPAAVGYRMASRDRPVMAVIGDGSSMYSIQSLWSAQRYGVGVLFVVLVNGGYAIMDRLARDAGGPGPWPQFADVSITDIARGFGCRSRVVSNVGDLNAVAEELMTTLRAATAPTVLVVELAQEEI